MIHDMTPVPLPIIGASSIGRKHEKLFHARPAGSLVGICDVDASCSSVDEEFNVPFYPGVEKLIEQERPRGAVIAAPNEQHESVAAVCVRRSVDVLIEKPIADTHEGALRAVENADATGIRVLVGHHQLP